MPSMKITSAKGFVGTFERDLNVAYVLILPRPKIFLFDQGSADHAMPWFFLITICRTSTDDSTIVRSTIA